MRKATLADFGAQMLSKGGHIGGGIHSGTRWEFTTKREADIWRKGFSDPRYFTIMSEYEIEMFVKEMGGITRGAGEVKMLMTPTDTISIGGDPYEEAIVPHVEHKSLKRGKGITSVPIMLVALAIGVLVYWLGRK